MKINLVVFKSIALSVLFRISSALIAFISVPLLLKTLGNDQYAIWVTLTALIAWISLFDFGSGLSLKNKVAESTATGDTSELHSSIAGTVQFYIITTVILLIIFSISLFVVKVFNDHIFLTCILYIPVILSFPLTLSNFILQGLKKFIFINFLTLFQGVTWLAIITLFKFGYIQGSLLKIGFFYSLSYFTFNLILFLYATKKINFSFESLVNFNHILSSKNTLITGLRFFVLQLSSLLLFSIGNIIVYNKLDLYNVNQYDTVNKVYLISLNLFNVIISIYWAEISNAKALKDKVKLRKIFNILILLSLAFSLSICIVTYFMPYIIKFWTKGMVSVKLNNLYFFAILVSIQAFAYSGAVFLNAFEKLKGQIIMSTIASLLMIPFAYTFLNYNYGISALPLSTSIVIFPTLIYVLYKAKKCIQLI